jgi:hypothetical protein
MSVHREESAAAAAKEAHDAAIVHAASEMSDAIGIGGVRCDC